MPHWGCHTALGETLGPDHYSFTLVYWMRWSRSFASSNFCWTAWENPWRFKRFKAEAWFRTPRQLVQMDCSHAKGGWMILKLKQLQQVLMSSLKSLRDSVVRSTSSYFAMQRTKLSTYSKDISLTGGNRFSNPQIIWLRYNPKLSGCTFYLVISDSC